MNNDRELTAHYWSAEARFNADDAETLDVLKGRVCDGSRDSYEGRNVQFLVWLFDQRKYFGTLLKQDLLRAMELEDEKDKTRRTKAGAPSKRRDHLRDLCRAWLRAIKPDSPETHPIELGALTFQVYSRYLNSFKKKVAKRPTIDNGAKSVAIRLSPSSFDGACSALAHLYHKCGLNKETLSKDLWVQLSPYKKGSRRTSASERKKLGMSVVEGKNLYPSKPTSSLVRSFSKVKIPSTSPPTPS